LGTHSPSPSPTSAISSGASVFVVGIFPDRDALIRLVGSRRHLQLAVADACGNPSPQRRYIGLDILAKSRLTIVEPGQPEEVTLSAITA
jgi:hypothetical protein